MKIISVPEEESDKSKHNPSLATVKLILRCAFHKLFMVRLLDRSEWERGIIPMGESELILYTNGSKTNEGIGAGVYEPCHEAKI